MPLGHVTGSTMLTLSTEGSIVAITSSSAVSALIKFSGSWDDDKK
jgi:hypothetical protein